MQKIDSEIEAETLLLLLTKPKTKYCPTTYTIAIAINAAIFQLIDCSILDAEKT
jgi:hypothetical protein